MAQRVTSTQVDTRSIVNSRGCQTAGVIAMFLLVAALHRESDGLWFQGDAPRHAINGLFWWDLVTAVPRDPVAYALSYYARYPVIAPVTYPPLFYLFEGLAFAAFGPSPYVAKSVVILFACVAGLYTMSWARRWIGAPAGWAGVFLAFVPGIVLWSNTVMLNVPSTALGLASLYHFRRWLETAQTRQLLTAACFLMSVLLTYYPSGSVVCILGVWALLRVRDLRFDRRLLPIAAVALLACIPLLAALLLAPVHTSRQLPTVAFLAGGTTWTHYWKVLPAVMGRPMLTFGSVGIISALAMPRWRREATYVGSWILVLILTLSVLPARDPRYMLLAPPAFTIAATLGIAAFAQRLPPFASGPQLVLLIAGLAAGLWSAGLEHVPQVSGFREIATDLRERAPFDAVLYEGPYDGLFGFYLRASDPGFERRLVLANRLLYESGPTTTFNWVQRSMVASTDDVVTLVRGRCGCRWVALEIDGRPPWLLGQRLLRQAVERGEFELVRSFPIVGAGERRVDLYRVAADVTPVAAVDLRFPSLTDREFLDVVPITR